MSRDVSNLSSTIIPKADQLVAEQLLGGPITVTVTGVTWGSEEQPVVIHFDGDDGRPFKPCKTMRKLLIFAWGDDGHKWVGKAMTLYQDPNVTYAGKKVGGVRISHLSDIDGDIQVSLTATKGKKETVLVKVLIRTKGRIDASCDREALILSLEEAASQGMQVLRAVWERMSPDERKEVGQDVLAKYKVIADEADAAGALLAADAPADDDPF